MYWAIRSDVKNNIIQQPEEDLHSLGQKVEDMTAKCASDEEEEQQCIVYTDAHNHFL